MAYFPTKVLDNQIKALPTVSTASGSVANFTTDMQENLVEVECEIVYSQASGTPSPSNPLPITTYTSLNLSHSGSDTSNPNVTNIPFGQTVAKGKLNVTTGVLEITHGVADNLNNNGWTYRTAQNVFSNDSILTIKNNPGDIKCDIYPFIGAYTEMSNLSCGYIFFNRFCIRDDSFGGDVNALKTALTGHKFIYPLATPQEIQLDSITLQALLNENNIWCDTNGDTSVKFILSVGEYINQNV